MVRRGARRRLWGKKQKSKSSIWQTSDTPKNTLLNNNPQLRMVERDQIAPWLDAVLRSERQFLWVCHNEAQSPNPFRRLGVHSLQLDESSKLPNFRTGTRSAGTSGNPFSVFLENWRPLLLRWRSSIESTGVMVWSHKGLNMSQHVTQMFGGWLKGHCGGLHSVQGCP